MKQVIVIGNGVRASGADVAKLLELGVPVLSSWQAADVVDNFHPMYFGRPGIYGQRCANKILYEADTVIAIGNRMTPWQIGHSGLRPEQQLYMVDVDPSEMARFPKATHILSDAKVFIEGVSTREGGEEWLEQCKAWREQYPWVEAPAHDDTNGFINSYRVIEKLQPRLREDEVIAVDVGCLMCPVFQSLKVKPPQRVITSGGLGEMGCGLPAAIGASFARDKGHVLCLMGDGGMMMNLQELQTIKHHELPIKILVFANDGYAMIKGTHRNLKIPYTGVDAKSGVSMPSFRKLAHAFGIMGGEIHSWEAFDRMLPVFLDLKVPALLEVFIDPEQAYVPRLQPIRQEDGTFKPARFDQLSP